MIIGIGFWVLSLFSSVQIADVRTIEYKGSLVKTTFKVEKQFYGRYKGRKSGFLILNEDGTGTYNYDIFGFAKSGCKPMPIEIEYGFLVEDDGRIVKFKRDYGYSYPILYKSLSATTFQGCREPVLLDFITIRDNGKLGVSSSDDWEK